MHSISDLQLLTFPLFDMKDSCLVVYEGKQHFPFSIQRVFVIKSTEENKRGFHAHKECSQILIALNGTTRVVCDDGITRKEYILNKPSEGLLIPPTLWAEQQYQPDAILMVLTDMPYDEHDYIRDYASFLVFRNKQ